MAISLIINGLEASLKKGSSIEYVSENRVFTDADDYSMEIELPLADCEQNRQIFGNITRKDIDTAQIFFDATLQDTRFRKRGAVVITSITQECVKVQFLEKRSYQNFYPTFDETYIDELDLGTWPAIYPDNLGSGTARPGYADDGQTTQYMSPAQLWARWQDYTALPWVNNTSGNLQNCARWNSTKNAYEWKVNPDDDNDTDFTKGLSFQPNLLWLTKKICEAMGYTPDLAKWENSDYKYLMVMNTIPYAWSTRQWAKALPHWTINEFFTQLEKLLLCEFDIDHGTHVITCSMSCENQLGAGSVLIEKVIDSFSVEVSNENKTEYKAMLNQGYADGGHRMSNLYNANWYIEQRRNADGTVACTEWATLSDLFNGSLPQDSVSDTGGSRSDYAVYPGGKWGLHYVKDIDTYFVLEVMKRVEYRTNPFNLHSEHMNWGNVCRLVPVNQFGDLIIDKDNPDDIDEINIIPAWLDETDEQYGNVVFLECGETTDDGNPYSHQTHQYMGGSSHWEQVDQDVPIQFGAYASVSNGEQEKSGAVFDKLYVAFWWGDYTKNKPHLPHPWMDKFDMTYAYQEPATKTNTSKLTITWGVIYSGKSCSLRINNRAYGQGTQRSTYIEVDQKRKYTFSFLADQIPNVRSVFYIEGKRYLCEKLQVTFTENGMSSLIKGDFYRLV